MALLSLWQLFVVETFGGFWLAVVGLTLVLFLILNVFGKVSPQSTFSYLILFWLAMAIGYGKPIITIPLTVFVFIDFGMQVASYFNKTQ